MKREGRRFFLTFFVCYLLMTLGMWIKQRDFLYFPGPALPSPAAAGVPQMDVIGITTPDGLGLRAWYQPPASESLPVIVMFHGNGGGIDIRANKSLHFTGAGYGVLLAEYRGYGGNPGRPTEEGLYNDARGYIEDLIKFRGIAADRIVLYGESLGTGVAVQMALEYPHARALILETPYTNLAWLAQSRVFWIPTYFLMKDRFDNTGKIDKISMPILIFHGTRDNVVPYSHGLKLFARAQEPKKFESFPGGGHVDLFHRGAAARVLAFMDEYAR